MRRNGAVPARRQEKPDSGELRIGDTVDVAYVDQTRAGPAGRYFILHCVEHPS